MITSLTPEQEARLDEYARRWIEIGLSTAPADRPEAEAGIAEAYRAAGLPPPRRIVWCGSPLDLVRARTRAGAAGASVWAAVMDGVRGRVAASIRNRVNASVWAAVLSEVGDRVSASVQHDASWLGSYEYFADVCGLAEETRKLSGLWRVARAAGWWLPHQHICWVSERPCAIKRDERGRLHDLAGPALAYPDGWAIHAVHGVRVPRHVIESPAAITVAEIERERNAEVRRVMIERYRHGEAVHGAVAYLRDAGSQVIDHDEAYGTLHRREVQDDEPIVILEVTNRSREPDGSYKHYFLRVPPDIGSSRHAWNWLAGYSPDFMPTVLQS